MEETQVIIVGAGPSGLVLGLALSKLGIRSTILEKETEITKDPRGVYLTGDAVRILYDLGLGSKVLKIGHEVFTVHFHQTSFTERSFYQLKIGTANALQQAVPEGILQSQPRLESALRDEIKRCKHCTLRTGCSVVSRLCEEPPVNEYIDTEGNKHQLKGQWLVGADGKVGIVRKHFLEPTAGIKQEIGRHPYDGTWIAANLRITPPTPESHPLFPLWKHGYTPEQVYDLFWPEGWHFCSPPGKPTATGRFGPREDRTWRHELRQEDWDDSMDAEKLFWEHITPMITKSRDEERQTELPCPVSFPQDCIEILRCRPFKFSHKVVNRWFHKRTILIGDAAHVFPPFAGQGIASGMRDAHQLAWRLALLTKAKSPAEEYSDRILKSWALERHQSVEAAAMFSMLNGRLCNNQPPLWLLIFLRLVMFVESSWFLPNIPDAQVMVERKGFTSVNGGFFLKDYSGGIRLAQIHVKSSLTGEILLSDELLRRSESIFTILVISHEADSNEIAEEAKLAVECARINPTIASRASVVVFSTRVNPEMVKGANKNIEDGVEVFFPSMPSGLRNEKLSPQDSLSYIDRLGRSTRFAVVRPDLFVYACCKNGKELGECMLQLKNQAS